jgi:hypothetical protein
MKTILEYKTQEGLKAFGFYSGEIDGVIGNLTIAAKQRMATYLMNKYNSNGYSINDSYFFGAIRMDENYTNGFTDWGFIATKGFQDVILFPMSTKPGIGAVKNPPTVAGKKGVAVLKEGQHLFLMNTAWWSGLPFLAEIPPFTMFRDYNLDTVIDRSLEQRDGTPEFPSAGINIHSWIGWISKVVSILKSNGQYVNLSEGCQVTTADIWVAVYEYLKLFNTPKILYTLFNRNFDVK